MEDRRDRTLREIQREYGNMPYNSRRVAVILEAFIPLSVPKKFPCWHADGLHDSGTLARWFYDRGTEIALRFDKRNGSDYYSKRMKKSEVWE